MVFHFILRLRGASHIDVSLNATRRSLKSRASLRPLKQDPTFQVHIGNVHVPGKTVQSFHEEFTGICNLLPPPKVKFLGSAAGDTCVNHCHQFLAFDRAHLQAL